VSLLLPSCWN